MHIEGEIVSIPSCRLYSDSYGTGPGSIISSGHYTCTRYIPGRIAPMHIETWGWVKCNPTGIVLTVFPPIFECECDEPIYDC